jgi:hypothetical protein
VRAGAILKDRSTGAIGTRAVRKRLRGHRRHRAVEGKATVREAPEWFVASVRGPAGAKKYGREQGSRDGEQSRRDTYSAFIVRACWGIQRSRGGRLRA